MERRYLPSQEVRVERREGGAARVSGYAAVYYDGTAGSEYQLWPGLVERIKAGAFDRAVREKQDVRALFNHDANFVLGRTTSGTLRLSTDAKGLRYEIDLPETTVAQDLAKSIERGDVSGSSFGFVPVKQSWQDGEPEIRTLEDVDLFDVSPVTYPAYSGTAVDVRSAKEAREAWKGTEEAQRLAAQKNAAAKLARVREIERAA